MAGKNDPSNQPSPDDIALFRREMAKVKRRPHDARNAAAEGAPKPGVKIMKTQLSEPAADAGAMIDQTDGDFLMFCRSGLQKKVIRKLKRGDYDFGEPLDLHGHTATEAKRMLDRFLTAALNTGQRSALIIHGKGMRSDQPGGVLKPLTANWLKQQSAVSAFCSAVPRDGGTGAVYVLLRLRRQM